MANEKRLIDANALLNDNEMYFCKPCKAKGHDYHEVACRACWVDDMRIAIEDAPTVDVEEAVHGRWIIKSKEIRPFEYVAMAECSECHVETESNRSLYISGFSMDMVDGIVRREAKNMGLGNYCPNCGADMRERKDNERKAD